MAKVKQLTVSLENRPGTLAQMAQVLADAKVNVEAILVGNNPGPQVVVDQIGKAKKGAISRLSVVCYQCECPLEQRATILAAVFINRHGNLPRIRSAFYRCSSAGCTRSESIFALEGLLNNGNSVEDKHMKSDRGIAGCGQCPNR